jgi:hypothetical protein
MNCPRCGAVLIERMLRKWLPFFECRQCCHAFELVTERHRAPSATGGYFLKTIATLQPGRTESRGFPVGNSCELVACTARVTLHRMPRKILRCICGHSKSIHRQSTKSDRGRCQRLNCPCKIYQPAAKAAAQR